MPRTRFPWPRTVAGLTVAAAATAVYVTVPSAQASVPDVGRILGTSPDVGRILGADSPDAIAGSYIVTLKSGSEGVPARSEAGKDLARKYGGKIHQTYGTVLNGYALRLDVDQARQLAADPKVVSVAQDTKVSISGTQSTPPSWGLDRIDQPDLPLDKSYTYPDSAGSGVTAYVIDTGVRTSHQDFGGRATSGYDFVDNDRIAQDGHGHGTHVAATVAGSSYGVAKGANVVGVRVLDDGGSGTTAQVIAGIDWVAKNARKPAVANMSLGGVLNTQLDEAVRNAIATGVTFTLAAGNDGLLADLTSPARVDEAVTVGATEANDSRAYFSNWGSKLDLFAPGVSITSAWNKSDTATKSLSGTSMAAPHVAGAAALHLASNPSASPAQVSQALVNQSSSGKVGLAGIGSPNRLLQVKK
ncbi:S8 family peptidase [Streptomyces gobiensis]|uniref:S8 family peptidase n=1 Tax=Streptomyces gobiensis TaxID=2875706 RepID=UPI001E63FAD8|nr:S8 family peptidase [Streptomyces gobiensis]UGY91049.1 S8 family peptidase [Streptomyces gobiensis]